MFGRAESADGEKRKEKMAGELVNVRISGKKIMNVFRTRSRIACTARAAQAYAATGLQAPKPRTRPSPRKSRSLGASSHYSALAADNRRLALSATAVARSAEAVGALRLSLAPSDRRLSTAPPRHGFTLITRGFRKRPSHRAVYFFEKHRAILQPELRT